MTIRDLSIHPSTYVTVGELAVYWEVSRRQVYKHVESGALTAIRLGPRCYRIRARDAADFERLVSSSRKGQPVPAGQPVESEVQALTLQDDTTHGS